MNNFKRFVSVFVAAMLVLSSIKFSDYIAKAEPSVQSSNGTVVYDFEDGDMTDMKVVKAGDPLIDPVIADIADKTGNGTTKALKIGVKNYCYTGIIFPFELEAGAKYEISYDYRSDVANVAITAGNSGVYAGNRANPAVAKAAQKFSYFHTADTWPKIGEANKWYNRRFTFDATDTQVTGDNKYLDIALQGDGNTSTSYVYLDNVKIEKVGSISFKAYVDGVESAEISVDPITGKVGATVPKNSVNVPCYDIVGIYEDAERTIPFEGENFTIKATETTYYLDCELKQSARFNFEDGDMTDMKVVKAGDPLIDPVIADIADKTGNGTTKALKIGVKNYCYTGIIFPFELEAGAKYEISYDYRSDVANVAITAGNSGVYAGNRANPAVAKAAQKFSYFHTADTWPKIGEANKWYNRRFTFDATDTQVTGDNKYLDIALQGDGNSSTSYVYLDNVVIKKIDPNVGEYDFEDGMKDISFVKGDTPSNVADPVVVETTGVDGGSTNALKVQTYNWNWTKLIFPFELEAGATYKISYDYKCDRPTVSLASPSGILAATSAGGTVYANKFGFFIQESGAFDWSQNKISDTNWHSREFTFTANDTQVTNDYKYLAIMLDDTTGGIGYIYLDNIVIKKDTSGSVIKFKAYVNGVAEPSISLRNLRGTPGTTFAFDCLDVPGYRRLGIYKDEALSDEFTGTEFTISEDTVTFYVNYEPLPIGTINFVAYEGDTQSSNITIPPVSDLEGETVSFNHLRVFGYDVVGIFKDAGLTDEFTGNEFTIGSTATTYYVKYAAKTYNGGVYDFETDAKSFLDFGIQYEQNSADVAVVSDAKEDGNKCLRLYNSGWKGMIVNFPYILKNNTSYRITYRLRSDEGVKVRSDAGGAKASQASCIYAGKSTGVLSTAGDKIDVKNNLKNYLAYLYDVPGQTGTDMYGPSLPKEWTTQSWTFTTGADTVDDTFKYLAFNFYPTCDADKYATLYLDDIVIEEVCSIRFVAYENRTPSSNINVPSIEGDAGVTRSLDCVNVPGYDIEGIYTDSFLRAPFTGDIFTLSEGAPQTYYVNYVPNDKVYRFKLENSADIKKTIDRAAVTTDPDGSGNKVLAFGNNWRESLASFPYELQPNTTYTLKLSYRSSSEGIVPRLYVYGVKDGSKLLENDAEYTSKRLFSIMDAVNSSSSNSLGSTVTDNFGKWITKEYVFTTGDKVDGDYKYFALGGKVQHFANDNSECLLVDNIEIKKLDATVSFNVSYDGQKIDVPNTYPNIGDTITLPTTLTNPFELEGWYYDSACTQAVGSTLTVRDKNTVLYGKATKKNTYTIDFEDNTDLVDGWGNWFGIGAVVTTDPDNSENHVLRTQATAFGNYVLVRLNYQLQSNRIYEISVKYRGVDQSASIALIASKIRYPENGMGVLSGPESNRLQNSILPFVTQENVPARWQTASLKITTDQPEITDDLKYLTIYFENRVSNTGAPNNRSLSIAYIDDITVTDVGEFDPTSVEIEDAGKWTLPKEDSSIWKDWSSWITGKFESIFDTDNDFNFNDYDYENSDNSFEVIDESAENTENTAEQQPNRKKKIIKKVIVTQQSYVWVIIVVAVAVVLVGAGLAGFLIIKKRRGRKS